MTWIGLDIGGANLKLARSKGGSTRNRAFALWRESVHLKENLVALAKGLKVKKVAVTMTGELCDCFENKETGVRFIVRAAREAFPYATLRFWTIDQTWVDEKSAIAHPRALAAANWVATACLTASLIHQQDACLVDMGSTTTDIIPITNGKVAAKGKDDQSRLEYGELVYTGTRRTPLMALLGPRVCAEYFATIHDARIWLGLAKESPGLKGADGKPMTRARSRTRLARMLGADDASISDPSITMLAQAADANQEAWVSAAVNKVFGINKKWPETWIVAGDGEETLASWIKSWGCKGTVLNFSDLVEKNSSRDAAAKSVAKLAECAFGP